MESAHLVKEKKTQEAVDTLVDHWTTSMRVTTRCVTCAPRDVGTPPLLVVIHGWGQTATAFLDAFKPLARQGWLIAAPQAPHPFYVTPRGARVGYSWLTRENRDAAVRDINLYLTETLDMIARRFSPDEKRVCLLGFSQGSSVAYRYLAAHPERIGALASCCADLPADVRSPLLDMKPRSAFVAYCPEDRIAPSRVSREAAAMLRQYGWPTTEYSFRGGHRITPALITRLGAWLQKAFPSR